MVSYFTVSDIILWVDSPLEFARFRSENDVGISPDVLDIGDYGHRGLDPADRLTDRQFEAVSAAVDAGYYDDPRAGSVGDVADRLGCAPGTAAEHRRCAERTIMADVVTDSPQSLSESAP